MPPPNKPRVTECPILTCFLFASCGHFSSKWLFWREEGEGWKDGHFQISLTSKGVRYQVNEVIKHIKYLISNNLREWAEKFATILSCNVKSRAQWVSLQQNIVVFRSEHKVSEKLIAKSILINPNQIDLRIDDNSKNDNAWDDLCEAVAGSCWSHIDNYIGRPLGTIVGGGDDVAMTIEIRNKKERNKKQEIRNKKYKSDSMMRRWPTIVLDISPL